MIYSLSDLKTRFLEHNFILGWQDLNGAILSPNIVEKEAFVVKKYTQVEILWFGYRSYGKAYHQVFS
jgi:hypothetical protein